MSALMAGQEGLPEGLPGVDPADEGHDGPLAGVAQQLGVGDVRQPDRAGAGMLSGEVLSASAIGIPLTPTADRPCCPPT
jgi:hypothetical protein